MSKHKRKRRKRGIQKQIIHGETLQQLEGMLLRGFTPEEIATVTGYPLQSILEGIRKIETTNPIELDD